MHKKKRKGERSQKKKNNNNNNNWIIGICDMIMMRADGVLCFGLIF